MSNSITSTENEVAHLQDVFTPSSFPEKTFVERQDVSGRLATYLEMPGRPICLLGPHRSGKSVLAVMKVKQLFKRHVHVICKTTTTFDQLVLETFNALSPYYDQARNPSDDSTPPRISPNFIRSAATDGKKTTISREQRGLPPQLTTRALAGFAVEANAAWIIDDIHKLASQELVKVAEAMREWQALVLDNGYPKMVVIGTEQLTTDLPSKLIDAAPDLRHRLVSIPVSLMSEFELRQILNRGAKLLNVDFSKIVGQLVKLSFGFPGVCQDLCYHTCHAAKVYKTAETLTQLNSSHLEAALKEYVDVCAPSIKHEFSQFLKYPISGLPAGFTKIVLDMVEAAELNGIDLAKLTKSVTQVLSIDETQLEEGLTRLTDDEKGVLRVEPQNSLVHFREPMYFIYYRHGKVAMTGEVGRQLLVSKFLEIIKG
jgi:hypothetical protein